MHRRIAVTVFSVLVALGGLVRLAAAETTLQVHHLRCEYLTAPQGIDVVDPRLSWQIQSSDPETRGVRQSAYQILVAGATANLDKDQGDLWDSGRVASDQSTQVVYHGKPLTSRVVCYWKVRVWDQDGRASAWSKPSRWSMGLLTSSDWKAQWIGVALKTNPSKADPWFRKDFSISGRPVRAVAYVASLGYHELYINGKKVDDRVLAPSISDFSQRVRYVTYDVTDCLRDGTNAVGLWCAAGWAGFSEFKVKDKPLVMAQIEVVQPDGRSVQLLTDAAWKTHPSPLSPTGNWCGPGYGGESFDARLEIPGWSDTKTMTLSDWDFAAVFKPQVRLSAEMIEPNRRVATLKPVAIEAKSPGVFRVDMGRNYAGWLEIRLKGKPGQKVTLQFSERPEQAKTFEQSSEYIFGDSGEGVFCQRFNHATARWITISGLETAPQSDDIRGFLISTDYARAGEFKCSNELLNRIYETTLWTFRSLSSGGYTVDCPHRERMGYGGDAHATMETAMSNFAVGAFYTKWLGDWRDVQRPNGDLPYTAPTYIGGGGPAWSGICVTLPWQVYLHYGDRRVLETCYPTMQRWLTFFTTHVKNHQLQPWGGVWDFLGDWVPPGVGQEPGKRVDDHSTLFFNNCYYLDNIATAAKIADLLGKSEDAAAYRKEASEIAEATHKAFFHPESNSYANGTQLYEALPVLVGVTPPALQSAVIQQLEDQILVKKRGHVDTGIHGTYYLLKTLIGQNRNDLVFPMVNQKTYPGWGYMLERGATTIWEEWNGDNSWLHSSFISVGFWFIEGVAGIRLDSVQPGYQHCFIRPGIVGDLTSAKGEFLSPYGKIVSDWKLTKDELTLNVEVPANSSATVFVPTDDPASVTESGRPVEQSPGVRAVQCADGATAYEVGSGRYTFRAHRQKTK
jgi:hypothetical protein